MTALSICINLYIEDLNAYGFSFFNTSIQIYCTKDVNDDPTALPVMHSDNVNIDEWRNIG